MHLTKTCTNCQETKPLNCFPLRIVKGKKYPRTRCKPCWNQSTKTIAGTEKRKRKNARRYQKLREGIESGDLQIISRYILKNAKGYDKLHDLKNDLNLEFVKNLCGNGCTYCGDTYRIGIDRINNKIGHLQDNVVGACTRCNLTRGDMPYEAWKLVAPVMREARERGLFGDWIPGNKKASSDRLRT